MKTWVGVTKKGTQAVLALTIVGCLSSGNVWGATVVVDDPFTDGDFTNGADPLDVEWRTVGGNVHPDLSVLDDSGAGNIDSGNALFIDRKNNGGNGIAADLPAGQRKLVDVGDFIKLEFDYRFTGNIDFATNVTNRGFRGGFFNRNGTADDTPFPAGQNDDLGYYFQTGVGNNDPNFPTPEVLDIVVNQEQGENNGPGNGSDKATGANGVMLEPINDSLPGSAVFTLTKTALGVLAEFSMDNGSSAPSAEFYVGSPTGSQPALDIDRFEYFAIVAAKKPYDLFVDNVRVTTNAPVPEPSSLALIGLGLSVLGLRRRR